MPGTSAWQRRNPPPSSGTHLPNAPRIRTIPEAGVQSRNGGHRTVSSRANCVLRAPTPRTYLAAPRDQPQDPVLTAGFGKRAPTCVIIVVKRRRSVQVRLRDTLGMATAGQKTRKTGTAKTDGGIQTARPHVVSALNRATSRLPEAHQAATVIS